MGNRSAALTVPGLLLPLFASLMLAQPAAALDADYWRGGWRTPLGDEPHIYQFVIRGTRVTGVYCRNCSDATTIGFIGGTWDESSGCGCMGVGTRTASDGIRCGRGLGIALVLYGRL